MHHKAVLTVGKFPKKPYHIECACHSAGDFPKEAEAVSWFSAHCARLGKSETWELSVPGAAQKKPAPPPSPVGAGGGNPQASAIAYNPEQKQPKFVDGVIKR